MRLLLLDPQMGQQAGLQAGENKKEQTRRLKYGFTCQVKDNLDHSQCVICGDVLANESLKPVKMK